MRSIAGRGGRECRDGPLMLATWSPLRQAEIRMREKVEQVIEVIRPAIQADNGDIILHAVDETTGVVEVELIGACVSCPASTVTLKAGIERILKDRVEGITEVVDVGLAKTEIGETSVSL